MHPSKIVDPYTKKAACVTEVGELVVAPFAYNDIVFNELAANDTAYNFYEPRVGFQFVITGIVARADQQVSSTVDATVVVYEAVSDDTTDVAKVLYQDAMVRGDRIDISPNVLVREGYWINAKTSDDDIHMNIMGYYRPSVS